MKCRGRIEEKMTRQRKISRTQRPNRNLNEEMRWPHTLDSVSQLRGVERGQNMYVQLSKTRRAADAL